MPFLKILLQLTIVAVVTKLRQHAQNVHMFGACMCGKTLLMRISYYRGTETSQYFVR